MSRAILQFMLILFCNASLLMGQKLLEVHQWAKYFESDDKLFIDADEHQNLYVAGVNTKQFDLDFGPAVVNSKVNGSFIAKYDKDFNLLFYHTYEGNAKFTEIKVTSDLIYVAITYGEDAVVETIDQKNGSRFSLFSFSASASAKIYSIAKDSHGTYYFAGAVGGFCTIYGEDANQIGSGENGILIRFDPTFKRKFWVRRFTNWGYPGDYKDIDASIVYLNSDNDVVTIGNSVIATYVYEQSNIENQNSAGFVARCDSTGKFSSMVPAYYVTNEAGTKVELNELNGNRFLYDNYGMGRLNSSFKVDYLKLPFKSGNGYDLKKQLAFNDNSIYFSASGLSVEVDGEKIRNVNNLIYHQIVGEMDENLGIIWYQHLLPYTRLFETRMVPWGDDKILFTGIFYYDTDIDPSLQGVNILKSSNGNRFFAIYDVSCRRLNLKISEVRDLSCELQQGNIKVLPTSPNGKVSLFFDNVPVDSGITSIPVLTSGFHTLEARDSICTQQKVIYVQGPQSGSAKPGIGIKPSGTRAGVASQLSISLSNPTCVASSGKLQIEMPKYFIFISADVPHEVLSNGILELDVKDVIYGKTYTVIVKYKVDGMAPPGEEVCLKAAYMVNEIADTTQVYCQTITNSFDPNDLHVFPGGRCEANYILNSENIEYLINFQNLGNDSAFHVSILDTLDAQLDLSTLYLLESSHKVSLTAEGNILRFDFKDINLQAKSKNEAKSKGFVRFSIKQNTQQSQDYKYENRAHIFFDFNKAVTTNDVFNTLTDQLPACIITKVQSIRPSVSSIYPNPATEHIFISNLQELSTIHCFDQIGRMVYQKEAKGDVSIPVSDWNPGLYFLKITQNNGMSSLQKVVVSER